MVASFRFAYNWKKLEYAPTGKGEGKSWAGDAAEWLPQERKAKRHDEGASRSSVLAFHLFSQSWDMFVQVFIRITKRKNGGWEEGQWERE